MTHTGTAALADKGSCSRGAETVSLAILFESRVWMERQQTQDSLLKPDVFDAAAPAITQAWAKNDTKTIEQLLQIGDQLNRKSWQAAIGIFNAAKDHIDLARQGLGQLVRETEAALAPYAIDYNAIVIDRSGTLYGEMQHPSLPPRTVLQKLDYGQGVGSAVGKAVGGSGSWQMAAVAVAFAGIMMAVNHQKLLRQLRELEGQVKQQAQLVCGDAMFIANELRLRMVPQFDGLVTLIERLRAALQTLRDAEEADTDPKAKAFHLACTFREAQYLLEMKAGN